MLERIFTTCKQCDATPKKSRIAIKILEMIKKFNKEACYKINI